MRYKKIGETKVPAVGQGTGGIYNENIIKAGMELGLTLIDTAESYGNEEIIGKAIKGMRDQVFISTKFSPEHNDDVIASCEGSLARLGTDYIDLYSMHYPNPYIPLENTIDAVGRLIKDGKIRYFGVCNTRNIPDSVSAVQMEYNLFDRTPEDGVLSYCGENDITFIAYSPLLDFHQLPPERMIWLQEIGMKYNRPLSQLILNWLISHNPVVVIPRSSKMNHIHKNATASDFMMSPEDLQRIDKLFTPDIVYLDPKQIDMTLTQDKFPSTEEESRNYEKWVVKPQDVDLDDYKPVKIRMAAYGDYELIEGGLRYWAWVIQRDEPMPCIVKNRWIQDFKGMEEYMPKTKKVMYECSRGHTWEGELKTALSPITLSFNLPEGDEIAQPFEKDKLCPYCAKELMENVGRVKKTIIDAE